MFAKLDAVSVRVGYVSESKAGDATVVWSMDDTPAGRFYFAASLVDVVHLETQAGHPKAVVASLMQGDRGVAKRQLRPVGRLGVCTFSPRTSR